MQIILDSETTDPVLFAQVLAVFNEFFAERAAEFSNEMDTIAKRDNPFVPMSEGARLDLETQQEDAAVFASAPSAPPVPPAPSTAVAAPFPTAHAPAPAAPLTPPGGEAPAPMPAPPVSAPSAPAAAPNLAVVDSEGLPWDVRIHADTRTKIGNGTWRIKRGATDDVVAAVKAELRLIMGIPTPAVPVPQPQAPAPTATPTASSAPVAAPPAMPSPPQPAAIPSFPSAPSAVSAPASAPVLPAVVPASIPQAVAPILLPKNAQEFMATFTQLMQAQKCTPEDGKNACLMNGLTGGVPNVFQRPDMAEQCMRSLCDMRGIAYTIPG